MNLENNSLRFYTDICAEIAQQLSPCFGPCGLDKFVNSSCGVLMSVHSGKDILESLSVNHPIGKLIIECVLSHQSKTGNHSKEFMVLLSNIMSKISVMHERYYIIEIKLRMLLVKSLRKFRNCIFPNLIIPEIVRKSVYCSLIHPEVIKTIIYSSLSSGYPRHATLFTNILYEIICFNQAKFKPNNLKLKLNNLTSDFDEICISSYNETPENSRIEKMVILGQDYLTFYPLSNHSHTIQDVRFILFKMDEDHTDDLLIVNGVQQTMAAFCFRSNQWKIFCKYLSTFGIKLIISNSKIANSLKCWCVVNQISTVECLPDDDMNKLSKYFSIHPSTIRDFKSNEGVSFGMLKSFGRTIINGHCYAFLEPSLTLQVKLETIDCCDIFPFQIIVCGSSSNSCHQTIKSLRNALKQLSSWLIPYRLIKNTHNDLLNNTSITEAQDCAGGDQFPTVDAFVDRCTEGILISSSSDYKLFGQDHSLSTMGVHLPVGGTFEIIAYEAIKDVLNLSHENQTQNDISEIDLDVIKIIMEALLEVPHLLITNSYATDNKIKTMAHLTETINRLSKDIGKTDNKRKDITSQSHQIGIREVQSTNKMDGGFVTVNCRSGKLEKSKNTCPIEPLRNKVEMIYDVLVLCEQLLRLEAILPVRKL